MTNRFYSHSTAAPVSQTRGTSSTMRTEFDSIASAFDTIASSVMSLAVESGTLSNFLLTLTPMPVVQPTNGMYVFTSTHSNTGASTMQIGSLAAIPLLNNDGTPLAAGNISAGTVCLVYTNGTNAYLMAAPKSYVDNVAISASLPGQVGNGGKWLQTNGATAAWQSLAFGNGSVGAPSGTFGDAATGFYRPALNQVGLSVSGVQLENNTSTGKTLVGNLVFGTGVTMPSNMTVPQLLALTGAPKSDGTGASGTWGINISGTAAVASNATQLGGISPGGYQTVLGYTPVQQGTGTSQGTNAVKIGYGTGAYASKLALSIDASDFGFTWPISITGAAATAITQANNDSSTNIANTAWVRTNGSALGTLQPSSLSNGQTIAASQLNTLLYLNSSGGTVYLPASGMTSGSAVCLYCISNAGVQWTVTRTGSPSIYAQGASGLTSIYLGNGDSVMLVFDGGNWVQASGSQDIGVGQSWQNVTGSRLSGGIYPNSTGKPIQVHVVFGGGAGGGGYATVAGLNFGFGSANQGSTSVAFIVPAGATYGATATLVGITNWAELR